MYKLKAMPLSLLGKMSDFYKNPLLQPCKKCKIIHDIQKWSKSLIIVNTFFSLTYMQGKVVCVLSRYKFLGLLHKEKHLSI